MFPVTAAASTRSLHRQRSRTEPHAWRTFCEQSPSSNSGTWQMQNKRVNLLRMALIFVNLVFESFSICCSPCIVFFVKVVACILVEFEHFNILICARRWLATFFHTKSRSLMDFICAFSHIYVFDKSPGPRARCWYIAKIGRTFVSRIAFIRTLFSSFLLKRVSFCS